METAENSRKWLILQGGMPDFIPSGHVDRSRQAPAL